jgi:NosR/NirI family nitrous oxide reductase transcriptional regulator
MRAENPDAWIRQTIIRKTMKRYGEPRAIRMLAMLMLWLCAVHLLAAAPARADSRLDDFLKQVAPAEIFPGADRVGPVEGNPPASAAYKSGQLLGYAFLNADVVNSTGYSG